LFLCICGNTTRLTKKHRITKKHTKALINLWKLQQGEAIVCLPCLQQGKVHFIPRQLVKLREHFKNIHGIGRVKSTSPIGVVSASYDYLVLSDDVLLLDMIFIYNTLGREQID